jgi:hypothetical protein
VCARACIHACMRTCMLERARVCVFVYMRACVRDCKRVCVCCLSVRNDGNLAALTGMDGAAVAGLAGDRRAAYYNAQKLQSYDATQGAEAKMVCSARFPPKNLPKLWLLLY